MTTSRAIDSETKEKVLDAIANGMAKSHAAQQFGVSPKTVARWAESAGVKGTYRPKGKPPVKRDRLMEYVLDQHRQHKTVAQIAAEAPESVTAATVAGWLRHSGERPLYAVTEAGERKKGGRQRHPMFDVVRDLYLGGRAPKDISLETGVSSDQISQWASRHKWSMAVGRTRSDIPGRPRDPSLWSSGECRMCGAQIEFRKSQPRLYCSNKCAVKHTKIKHHIVLRDHDVVLDSSYEAAVWGALRVAKIPVERFDRQYGVEWAPGHWYAPDLWLPQHHLAIETKGFADPEDEAKWAAFRSTSARLVVLGDDDLVPLAEWACGMISPI